MRKIAEMKIACFHTDGGVRSYLQDCTALVAGGFVPYGKPYYHGSMMFREFVKYEIVLDDDTFDFENGETGTDPWEEHDFFSEIDDI